MSVPMQMGLGLLIGIVPVILFILAGEALHAFYHAGSKPFFVIAAPIVGVGWLFGIGLVLSALLGKKRRR